MKMVEFNDNNFGVLGGTFDPPHLGHLKISSIAIKKLKLKKLIWVITKQNPFKEKSLFTVAERIKKSKELTNKKKTIQVKYYDHLLRSSNTIDLIKYLKKTNKNLNIFLIIGSDNLTHLHKWKGWKLLLKMVTIVVFSRNDFSVKSKKSAIVKKVEKRNKIIFIDNKKINISSTKIRQGYLS